MTVLPSCEISNDGAVVALLAGMTHDPDTTERAWEREDLNRMQVYALTSSRLLHETLDLFLTGEAAEEELRRRFSRTSPNG
jgi:hypothetical protein